MKNLKLISLALVIVSSGLFASNSVQIDFITENTQPVPKKVFEINTTSQEVYQNFEIKYDEKIVLVTENLNKIYNEASIQKKLNYNNLQDQAARSYTYDLRPDIISKE